MRKGIAIVGVLVGGVLLGATLLKQPVQAAKDVLQMALVVNTSAQPVPVSIVSDGLAPGREPVRFEGTVFSVGSSTLIPSDAVPAGKTLILTYVSTWGVANIAGTPVANAGCGFILVKPGGSGRNVGGLPLESSSVGAVGSQAVFIPLSSGEGFTMYCSGNAPADFRTLIGGYFVPSP